MSRAFANISTFLPRLLAGLLFVLSASLTTVVAADNGQRMYGLLNFDLILDRMEKGITEDADILEGFIQIVDEYYDFEVEIDSTEVEAMLRDYWMVENTKPEMIALLHRSVEQARVTELADFYRTPVGMKLHTLERASFGEDYVMSTSRVNEKPRMTKEELERTFVLEELDRVTHALERDARTNLLTAKNFLLAFNAQLPKEKRLDSVRLQLLLDSEAQKTLRVSKSANFFYLSNYLEDFSTTELRALLAHYRSNLGQWHMQIKDKTFRALFMKLAEQSGKVMADYMVNKPNIKEKVVSSLGPTGATNYIHGGENASSVSGALTPVAVDNMEPLRQ